MLSAEVFIRFSHDAVAMVSFILAYAIPDADIDYFFLERVSVAAAREACRRGVAFTRTAPERSGAAATAASSSSCSAGVFCCTSIFSTTLIGTCSKYVGVSFTIEPPRYRTTVTAMK
jgi:hypothetical protein